MTYITSGIYGSNFSTYTRDGKLYYKVTGYNLGRVVYRPAAAAFYGSSTNPRETIGWCTHISESAYNGLSDVMKEAFDASSHKVAEEDALTKIPTRDGYFKFGLTRELVYKPCTEGTKRDSQTCWDGTVVHKEVCRSNKWALTGETCPPKPECAEGDKKPGNICSGGKWVPYTPETRRLYIKFAIPWLDLLPGIPYEPWMIIPPGFKITEEP